MAKAIFFAAILSALVAVSVAQSQMGESEQMMRFRDRQCLHEVQESSLEACRQVLDRQLTGREQLQPMYRQGAMGMRMQCCQQLQDVSRECRCSAIRQMVRDYEQSMPMPAMEEGYYGEGSSWQQQEQGRGHYYGEGSSAQQQQEQGYYGEMTEQQQQQPEYGEQQQQPRMTRVRLIRARQFAAQLPAMCRVEPQQCSIFAAGQY